MTAPIRLFAPYVTDFWFVDIAYFRTGRGLDQRLPSALAADIAPPVLEGRTEYELLDTTVIGPSVAQHETRQDSSQEPARSYPYLEPCVRTDLYRHTPTGKQFRVHRRRGYSYCAFNKVEFVLGVFFYRGDSGEGSNTPWLSTLGGPRPRSFIGEVLERLVDGGLLVTDGSRCGEYCPLGQVRHSFPYAELARFREPGSPRGPETANLAHSITDPAGRRLDCVGYAGAAHSGPTLIWKVTKPSAEISLSNTLGL